MRAGLLGACLALLVIAPGCGPAEDDPEETPTPTATPTATPTPGAFPSPACFVGGADPQLDLDAPVLNWTWNDPSVIKVGAEYWMYASATDNYDFPVRLYRLVSTDGATWALDPPAPILADAAPAQWDSGGTETPSVVFYGGMYHLFYTGYDIAVGEPGHSALEYRFGHATSVDGITFTRDGAGPLVVPSDETDGDLSDDWFAYFAAEPGAVVHDGELKVYFTTMGLDYDLSSTLQVVGMITTTNGTAWTAPELALKPDQAVYPRGDEWVGYSTPSAIVIDDAVHVFVDVASEAGGGYRQMHLHHASSADGRTAWTSDTEPFVSVPFSYWVIDQVNAPAAFLEGDQLRLYFAGQNVDFVPPDNFGVGMLTCDR